jgi:hypothetical protein
MYYWRFIMRKDNFFAWGMLAAALAFGAITAGCGNGAGGTEEHEHIWGDWVLGTPVWGKWQTNQPATQTASGTKYRDATRTDTRTCTIDGTSKNTRMVTYPEDPSLRDTGIIPAGKMLDSNGNEVDMAAPTLPGITPKDVKVIETLGMSGAGSTVIANVNAGQAGGAVRGILPELSTQADGLVSFFNTAKTSYPALAAKFETLRAAEQQMNNRRASPAVSRKSSIIWL